MMQRPSTARITAAQRGTTLVEILIVLVILVLGILSLLRIFPGGFLAVRSAENITFADRLAQGALESLKQNSGALPDGIYVGVTGTDPVTNLSINEFDPTVRPDDLGQYPALPAAANVSDNDINKARYVSSETFTIPAGHIVTIGSTPTALPPIHLLNFGPIYLPANVDPTQGDVQAHQFETYLSVKGMPWTPEAADSTLPDTNPSYIKPWEELSLGNPKFLQDAPSGMIAIAPATYPQYFTLLVQVTGSILYTVHLTIPPVDPAYKPDGITPPPADTVNNYNGNWFSPGDTALRYESASDAPQLPNPGSWAAVSVVLERDFRCVNAPSVSPSPWTGTGYDFGTNSWTNSASLSKDDPYQYALCNPNLQDNTGVPVDFNLGVIAFPPAAAGQNGHPPLQAKISYTTLDWHILHDDRDVPQSGAGTIRLTLGNLKKFGDVQFDNTTYGGVFPINSLTANSAYDILMMDTDTGQIIPNSQSGFLYDVNSNSVAATQAQILVDYKAGRVTLPADTYGGKHLRVFYEGDADWAVAIQKASSVYARVPQSMNGTDDLTYLTTIKPGPSPAYYGISPALQHVDFPLCDASKTVELDGISYYDKDGTLKRVNVATGAISDTFESATSNYAYVDLSSQGLNVLDANYDPTRPIQIESVRGISARAVVIWKERGQWKTHSVDTLLTSAP